MRALITGASSGIGRDIARELASRSYDLVIVARNIDRLNELKQDINSKVGNINIEIVQMDLSVVENCIKLHEQFKGKVDLLINNAGFGAYGEFDKIDLEKELQLINTNITALHILTKLFLQDMKERNNGQILNVASIAGFLPGPLMSAYYASKAYVVRLSQGIREELRRAKSKVKISILCPGPVETNFNKVANVHFSAKPLSSEYVAKYTVKKLLKKKFYIVPGIAIKMLRHLCKFTPDSIVARFAYKMQHSKR